MSQGWRRHAGTWSRDDDPHRQYRRVRCQADDGRAAGGEAAGEDGDGPAAEPVVRMHKQAVRDRLGELIAADHQDLPNPRGLADHLFLILEGAVVHRGVDGNTGLYREARELWCDLLPPGAASRV